MIGTSHFRDGVRGGGGPVPTDGRRRFPRSVFDHGDDPDPRFSLANERTFLAWIRTGLAFVAAGLAVEALDVPPIAWLRVAISLLLVLAGIAATAQAWLSWMRT